MNKEGGRNGKMYLVILVVIAILAVALVRADPLGTNLNRGASSRGTNPDVATNEAQAGNVTALNIDQTRITDVWQGCYGNVSGGITLESGAGDSFYDWTLMEITGEIFATRNTIKDWTNMNCTNSTQWEEEENELNIPLTSTEGINETYKDTTHPSFFIGSKTIPADYCKSTRPYNSTGQPGDFYNVLLNSNLTNTVYTVVLSDDSSSFDGGTSDFEILLPTDRSTGTATYYFYAELD